MVSQFLQEKLSLTYSVCECELATPPLVVLLHGYGSHEEDLIPLMQNVREKCLIVSPRGPRSLGEKQHAWFALDHTYGVRQYDKDEVSRSRIILKGFIDEVIEKYHADPSRVFLIGFSQGAIMSYSLALTHPGFIKGVGALSGRILEEVEMNARDIKDARYPHVFIGHGTHDDVVPVHFAHEAKSFLGKLGVTLLYYEYPMAHTIIKEEQQALLAWLHPMLF